MITKHHCAYHLMSAPKSIVANFLQPFGSPLPSSPSLAATWRFICKQILNVQIWTCEAYHPALLQTVQQAVAWHEHKHSGRHDLTDFQDGSAHRVLHTKAAEPCCSALL